MNNILAGKKILLGVTGGISAYKICYLVRFFIKAGAEVRIIMTPAAAKFVSPLALSVLSNYKVAINMFDDSDDSKKICVEAGTWHVNYGLWADVFIIAPATANTIAKIVCGISDNFLLSVCLAARCPIVVAPAMDKDMYENKITQNNINTLISRGVKIIPPAEGELASGLCGIGRMAEPEEIYDFIVDYFSKKSDLKGHNILVTAGPTRENIDPVRFISNNSSGKMGVELARAAAERGAKVTLVCGPLSVPVPPDIKIVHAVSASQMFGEIKKNLKEKNLVVMAAAVADFKPAVYSPSKIKKQNGNLLLPLEKTTDILEFLGKNKKKFKLFGFALETENEIANAKKKLKEKNLDMIVLNNPLQKNAGFNTDTNIVTLIDKKKTEKLPLLTKYEVANKIFDRYLELA